MENKCGHSEFRWRRKYDWEMIKKDKKNSNKLWTSFGFRTRTIWGYK